jgi:transcriptional regulator with XRE-family HTH domain
VAAGSPDGGSLNTGQAAFAQRLRHARERQGLSIEAIAASTKIRASLFSALERGDVTQWPGEIFRRAFFREYVSALGLDPEPLLREFLWLFPENPALEVATASTRSENLRLTLASGRTWTAASAARQICTAVADLCGVATIGALIAQTGHVDFWTACGLTGVTYYAVSTAAVGRSALGWWIDRRAIRGRPRPATPDRLRIVSRQPQPPPVAAEAMAEEPPRRSLRAASR